MAASEPVVPPGRVAISETALAQLARATALDVYGVVGTASRLPGPGHGVAGLLGRPSTAGIDVTRLEGGGLRLDVHVILGRGLNLAAVAESLRARIVYRLEHLTGERVDEVVVHIDRVVEVRGLRRRSKTAAATVLLSARVARLLAAREGRARTVRRSRRSKRTS